MGYTTILIDIVATLLGIVFLGIIVFRALGFVANKDILEHICYEFSDAAMMELLRPLLEEDFVIQNQQVCYFFEFEFMFLMYMDIDSNSYLFFQTPSSNHLCKHPDRCNKLAFNFRREIQHTSTWGIHSYKEKMW